MDKFMLFIGSAGMIAGGFIMGAIGMKNAMYSYVAGGLVLMWIGLAIK